MIIQTGLITLRSPQAAQPSPLCVILTLEGTSMESNHNHYGDFYYYPGWLHSALGSILWTTLRIISDRNAERSHVSGSLKDIIKRQRALLTRLNMSRLN